MSIIKKHGFYESSRIIYLGPEEIFPNPAQPRKFFEPESLKELAASISRYAYFSRHRRRDGRQYELVSGERRLRAARLAGVSEIPCIILDVDCSQSSAVALVENLHRKDLDFIEEAEGIFQFIRTCGISQEEAARRLGRSQSAVANKLRILKLPGELLYTIREAGLSERHARALLPPSDHERIEAGEIIRRGLNVTGAENYIDAFLNKRTRRTRNGAAVRS